MSPSFIAIYFASFTALLIAATYTPPVFPEKWRYIKLHVTQETQETHL